MYTFLSEIYRQSSPNLTLLFDVGLFKVKIKHYEKWRFNFNSIFQVSNGFEPNSKNLKKFEKNI